MIGGREGEVGPCDRITARRDAREPRTGAVMQEMPVDMKQRETITEIGDDMIVPDLVEQRAGGRRRHML